MLSPCALPRSTLLLAFFIAQATALCTNFSVVDQSFVERGATLTGQVLVEGSNYHYRVSPGIVCPNGTYDPTNTSPCHGICNPQLTDGTIISTTGTTNVSITTSELSNLFSLVATAVHTPFPAAATVTLNNARYGAGCTTAGQWAGIVVFAPDYLCANGVVSGCDPDGDLADGTALRLCSPQTSADGMLVGGVYPAQTSVEVAQSLDPPPVPAQRLYGNYSDPTNASAPANISYSLIPSVPLLPESPAASSSTASSAAGEATPSSSMLAGAGTSMTMGSAAGTSVATSVTTAVAGSVGTSVGSGASAAVAGTATTGIASAVGASPARTSTTMSAGFTGAACQNEFSWFAAVRTITASSASVLYSWLL